MRREFDLLRSALQQLRLSSSGSEESLRSQQDCQSERFVRWLHQAASLELAFLSAWAPAVVEQPSVETLAQPFEERLLMLGSVAVRCSAGHSVAGHFAPEHSAVAVG